ncbi:Rgl1 [Kluyveromyces lactis]|nr:Rgl1 [Kluyveromyces lactis]
MTYPVISLKPSYNSIIRGCPGLTDTLPRIECELRIRSNDGKPFIIDKIQMVLKTIECLNMGLGSFTSKRNKLENESVHYKKNMRISDKKIIGLDIPLTIALPDDIKETNYNAKAGHSYTVLECDVLYHLPNTNSTPLVQSFSQMVNVERYVLIASPRLYSPVTKVIQSPDKKFHVKLTTDNPCVTTDDLLTLKLEIFPNLTSYTQSQRIFNKQIKLKGITLELKEILELYDANSDTKENVLESISKPFNDPLPESGMKLKMSLRVLTKNALFHTYETSLNEPAVMYQLPSHEPKMNQISPPQTVVLKGKHSKEPFQYHCSITTRGKLFSVTHSLAIKFKISKGKDFEISYPIDITPWPKSYMKHVEQLIYQEREIAKNAKSFYQNYGGIKRNKNGQLEYPPLPPVIYVPTKECLTQLGVLYNTESKIPRRVFVID